MIFNVNKGDNLPESPPIVRSDTLVTLLGGGEVSATHLAEALQRAPLLVAADGGADQALALGHVPQAVIGDMDSLSTAGRAALPPGIIHQIDEQTSTDFDKALRNISAPGVLAVGFTGRRIDHELAAYHTLVTRPEPPCIVLGGEDLAFHAPTELALDLPVGTRVSLFPLGPVRGEARGLRWPIEPIDFRPWVQIGTSNQTVAPRVEMRFTGPGMLVILPRRQVDAVLAALI